jgi:hypothetical protein
MFRAFLGGCVPLFSSRPIWGRTLGREAKICPMAARAGAPGGRFCPFVSRRGGEQSLCEPQRLRGQHLSDRSSRPRADGPSHAEGGAGRPSIPVRPTGGVDYTWLFQYDSASAVAGLSSVSTGN